MEDKQQLYNGSRTKQYGARIRRYENIR